MESFAAKTIHSLNQEPASTPAVNRPSNARFVAGGTTLIDLMKLNIEKPEQLLNINPLPFTQIEALPNGGLRIGALVRNSDLANHPSVKEKYKVLSMALLSGASPQIRNMATTGGNLLQRTRCYYFRDTAYVDCNKRNPGSGCAALRSFNRIHAVLGGSESCVATHPSDMAVAMMALEAIVVARQGETERRIPLFDFYLLPGKTPHLENTLQPGELITSIELPPLPSHTESTYLKRRDRSSYEFALASAAVVLTMNGHRIDRARIALGGLGTRPWRSKAAEKLLEGKEASLKLFQLAADTALHNASPLKDNAFKIPLGKQTFIRALSVTANLA